jgi:hypothetical protein
MTRLAIAPALAAAAALAAGCAGPQKKEERLLESLARYHPHLIAGEYEQAEVMVGGAARETFSALHDPSRTLYRPEDFNVLSMVEDPATGRIAVIVAADIRKENSITVRTIRIREVWQEMGGRWVMVSEEQLPAPGR